MSLVVLLSRYVLMLVMLCLTLVVGAVLWGRATGSALIYVRDRCDLRLLDMPTGLEQALTGNPCNDYIALSADGTRLAFTGNSLTNANLFIMDVSYPYVTHNPQQLTYSPYDYDVAPAWSPDGTQVAYWSQRYGYAGWTLSVIEVATSRVRWLGGFDIAFPSLSWSPDSEQLVFSAFEEGITDAPDRHGVRFEELYTITVDGRDLHQITDNYYRDAMPVWSLDGQWIAYVSAQELRDELMLLNLQTGEQRRLTPGLVAYSPAWSPDGQQIIFTSFEGNNNNSLYVVDIAGGSVRRLTSGEYNASEPVWLP